MDPVANPYRPGAGRTPLTLAGRESLMADFEICLRRAEEYGEGDRAWVLDGLRGMGKTALLNAMLGGANRRRWIIAKIEAAEGTPLREGLAHQLVIAMRTATGRYPESRMRRLLSVIQSFTVSLNPSGINLGLDVAPARGVADSGRFADDALALFQTMGQTSRELGIGTLILIDEMQQSPRDDLMAVNQAVHFLGQDPEPLPVLVVGAGLPSLPAVLAEASSYAERLYDFRSIGVLDGAASRRALQEPATQRGADWSSGALEVAVSAAGGYPYLLQSVGKHVWDVAVRSPISEQDVRLGLELARREVDAGLYRSRWERATPAQQVVLRAVAQVAGPGSAAVADVARAAGKARSGDISASRRELIHKGLLYSPDRGLLAFTVPGMHDFIQRQA